MANLVGGLTGAASGAALGTAALPGIGTAVGAGVGGLIGLFGGGGGGDTTAPALPPITDPVTGQQIAQAAGSTQSGLQQQQAFVEALNAQNGIRNQSQVYNQLQGVASGQGPNPAQAMLNQATGTNVSNQAALMASQRGAGANAGLIARQAAQQGASTQQQAAGQAATLQAQQSLGAIGQAGALANQQVAQQQSAIGNYNQFAQGNQGQLLGAQSAYNTALTGGQGSVNSANQNVADRNSAQLGGALQGAGAALGAVAPMFSSGASTPSTSANFTMPTMGAGTTNTAPGGSPSLGVNTKFADGGMVSGPSSMAGRHLSGKMYAKGGETKSVPALVSPGERYLPPSEVKKVASGEKSAMKAGEKIPGKPKVNRDSYANDTVPKTLKSGGIVLPLHVTQSKDAPEKAAAFVRAIMAKKGLK